MVLREFQEFGTFVYGEVAPTPGFPGNPLFLKRSKRLEIGIFSEITKRKLFTSALSCMIRSLAGKRKSLCNEIPSAVLANESLVEIKTAL